MLLTNLNTISPDTVGIIREINTDHVTKERLKSLGLISGVEIVLARKLPFGSSKIYKCLNTLIVLRNDIAKKIIIEVTYA